MAKAKSKKSAKAPVKAKAKKAAKPVNKTAKPAAKKTAKPTAKKATKKAVAKTKNKPVKKAKSVAKPASKKISKPTAKPASKPSVKKVHKPAALVKKASTPVHKKTNKKNMTDDLSHRYSDKELAEFKALIDQKLADAREELKNLKESLDNHTESQAGNKAWNMEEGTDTTEMEYLMNQISRQHQYIRNLELALVRIENKTYGICRVTGKLIPKERLRVVPHATLSLEAKMTRKPTNEEIAPAAAVTPPPADFAEGFED